MINYYILVQMWVNAATMNIECFEFATTPGISVEISKSGVDNIKLGFLRLRPTSGPASMSSYIEGIVERKKTARRKTNSISISLINDYYRTYSDWRMWNLIGQKWVVKFLYHSWPCFTFIREKD